jgi:hypothetical protein
MGFRGQGRPRERFLPVQQTQHKRLVGRFDLLQVSSHFYVFAS